MSGPLVPFLHPRSTIPDMDVWACAACGREFGRRQAHFCAPAMTLDEFFRERPAGREIFDAVQRHLESLGPVIVEPVGVGILFKGVRTFVELRPRARWWDLGFGLNRRVQHPRISRTVKTKTTRTYHGVRLTSAADVDETVRDWLTESYRELAV